MTSVRQAAEFIVPAAPRRYRRAPRAQRTTATGIRRRQIPAAAVSTALQLAGGDASRLLFDGDGSVYVLNSPRRQADGTA